jgi:hypothetical protein
MDNLEGLRCSYPSLIQGESVQPLEYLLDVLFSKEFLEDLHCIQISSSRVIQFLSEYELTWFSPGNLFGRQRKGREQFHEYLDHHLSNSDCRRDLRIDIETLQKVID